MQACLEELESLSKRNKQGTEKWLKIPWLLLSTTLHSPAKCLPEQNPDLAKGIQRSDKGKEGIKQQIHQGMPRKGSRGSEIFILSFYSVPCKQRHLLCTKILKVLQILNPVLQLFNNSCCFQIYILPSYSLLFQFHRIKIQYLKKLHYSFYNITEHKSLFHTHVSYLQKGPSNNSWNVCIIFQFHFSMNSLKPLNTSDDILISFLIEFYMSE